MPIVALATEVTVLPILSPKECMAVKAREPAIAAALPYCVMPGHRVPTNSTAVTAA